MAARCVVQVTVELARTQRKRRLGAFFVGAEKRTQVGGFLVAAVTLRPQHIADPPRDATSPAGHTIVGALSIRLTMEQSFYRDHLSTQAGLTVLALNAPDRDIVQRIIYEIAASLRRSQKRATNIAAAWLISSRKMRGPSFSAATKFRCWLISVMPKIAPSRHRVRLSTLS